MIWILFGKQVFNVASYLVTELLEGSLWKYFSMKALIFLHYWHTSKILLFLRGPQTSLTWQRFCETSLLRVLRDSDRWAVVNLSYEYIWMWKRVIIILSLAAEHKLKTTAQFVKITLCISEWIFIIKCCCALCSWSAEVSENIAFWRNSGAIYYFVTHYSTNHIQQIFGRFWACRRWKYKLMYDAVC